MSKWSTVSEIKEQTPEILKRFERYSYSDEKVHLKDYIQSFEKFAISQNEGIIENFADLTKYFKLFEDQFFEMYEHGVMAQFIMNQTAPTNESHRLWHIALLYTSNIPPEKSGEKVEEKSGEKVEEKLGEKVEEKVREK